MKKEDDLGLTANTTMLFAFPHGKDRWQKQLGNVSFVDGHFHKITVPGLETRSGESFGITATFHAVQEAVTNGPLLRGTIAKFIVQNGRVISIEVVARDVEID